MVLMTIAVAGVVERANEHRARPLLKQRVGMLPAVYAILARWLEERMSMQLVWSQMQWPRGSLLVHWHYGCSYANEHRACSRATGLGRETVGH